MKKSRISSQVVADVRLLLDTVAFIYAVAAPEKLSKRAAAALHHPDYIFELSTVSLSEIAIKASLGKLELPLATIREAITDLDIRLLPYTAEHALRLFELPLHHRDPFDRQIIATALCEELPIVTSGKAFERYEGLKLVW